MPSVADVADYFLVLAAAEDDDGQPGERLTHLKLQKLLYYAQGFHLAIFGRRLFPEIIQAWTHGPVVPTAFDIFSKHGGSPIPPPEIDVTTNLTEEQCELLNEVWNTYGQFSAWKLRNMTHEEPPWKDAYQPGLNAQITVEAMTRYFRSQVVDGEATRA